MKKAHGKGPAMSVKGASKRSRYLANVSEGCAIRGWSSLKRWPAASHPEQARLDAFRSLPSWLC